MHKLVLVSAGLIAAGSAAVVGAGAAMSQPANNGSYNVIGEPYNKAVQILQAQGIKASFAGSFGSVLNQSNCLVDSQKLNRANARMLLTLDCTQAAADTIKANGPAGGPSVGSNGVTTVTPTPVVQNPNAPGAGAPAAVPPPA